jgi:hypothetical protein
LFVFGTIADRIPAVRKSFLWSFQVFSGAGREFTLRNLLPLSYTSTAVAKMQGCKWKWLSASYGCTFSPSGFSFVCLHLGRSLIESRLFRIVFCGASRYFLEQVASSRCATSFQYLTQALLLLIYSDVNGNGYRLFTVVHSYCLVVKEVLTVYVDRFIFVLR